MRRPFSILIIAILLALPMAPGTLDAASGPVALSPDTPSLEIDLRIRLEGLESAWSGRIDHAEGIGEEIDVARRWFIALRALGRFTIRQAIHLIASPVLDSRQEARG